MASSAALGKLEHFLSANALADGDRLPPERTLAAVLGISRRALRQALATVELEGRVWRGVGQGTFVGPRPANVAVPLERALANTHPIAVMEARLTFEPALAAAAAVKWAPGDMEVIDVALRRTSEARDRVSWERWDAEFHRAVASACHNDLLIALFDQLNACRARTDWGKLRVLVTDEQHRRKSAEDHRTICSAIRARDPNAAFQAMWAHLWGIAQTMHGVTRTAAAGPDPSESRHQPSSA
jgi:DNA-binding FadR family transcriptional regulator